MYRITGMLGLALIVAPYILGYDGNTPAYWTSMLIGGVIVFVSFIEHLEKYDMWEYWVAAILGIVAILSPFIFGFSENILVMRMMVSTGLLLTLLSGIVVFHDMTKHRGNGGNGIDE